MRKRKDNTDIDWRDEFMITGLVRPGTNRFAWKIHWHDEDQKKYWDENRVRILKLCRKPYGLKFDKKKN